MRNLKRALSLGLTAAMISGLMVMGSSAASYADVTSEDNQEAIEVLEAVGIMIGDENGDFNPDQNVTRNEMAVVMSNLMEYNVASYKDTSPFTDVPSWAEPYVAACYTNGITAGTSATTYGGSDTVTTAQAALMLMKALGYFQYASDFGGDWQLATVRQGNDIDLFVGVDSGVQQAMTRNDVAQLVLNTLEAGTVKASTGGSITVGGVTINTDVKYDYVTSGETYAFAINDRNTNNDGDLVVGSIVELGEQLYMGDLRKSGGADNFDRPSSIWEYNHKEIGVYPDEANYTYTEKISQEDLYDELGSTIMGGRDPYTWEVFYNGEYLGHVIPERNESDAYSHTNTGTLTQVYLDSVERTVTVTMVDTFLAEVVSVSEKDDSADVTVNYLGNNLANTSGRQSRITLDSTDLAQGDKVLVTLYEDGSRFSIDSIELAETVTGEVNAVKSVYDDGWTGKYAVMDGTKYNYVGNTFAKDLADTALDDPTLNAENILYLDNYGNMIAFEATERSVDYLYIQDTMDGLGGFQALATFPDGTEKTITVTELDGDKNPDENDLPTFLGQMGVYAYEQQGNDYKLTTLVKANYDDSTVVGGNHNDKVDANGENTVYGNSLNTWDNAPVNGSYDNGFSVNDTKTAFDDAVVGSDDSTHVGDYVTYSIRNGLNSIRAEYSNTLGGNITTTRSVVSLNNSTIFVDVEGGAVYTGYSNVPTMTDISFYVVYNRQLNADVVFITDGADNSTSDSFFFVLDENPLTTENADDGTVYREYAAMVNGEETTVTLKGTNRDNVVSGANFIRENTLYRIETITPDGDVTEVSRVTKWNASNQETAIVAPNTQEFSLIYSDTYNVPVYSGSGTIRVEQDSNISESDNNVAVNYTNERMYAYDNETIFVEVTLDEDGDVVDVDRSSEGAINDKDDDRAGNSNVFVLAVDDTSSRMPTATLVYIVNQDDDRFVTYNVNLTDSSANYNGTLSGVTNGQAYAGSNVTLTLTQVNPGYTPVVTVNGTAVTTATPLTYSIPVTGNTNIVITDVVDTSPINVDVDMTALPMTAQVTFLDAAGNQVVNSIGEDVTLDRSTRYEVQVATGSDNWNKIIDLSNTTGGTVAKVAGKWFLTTPASGTVTLVVDYDTVTVDMNETVTGKWTLDGVTDDIDADEQIPYGATVTLALAPGVTTKWTSNGVQFAPNAINDGSAVTSNTAAQVYDCYKVTLSEKTPNATYDFDKSAFYMKEGETTEEVFYGGSTGWMGYWATTDTPGFTVNSEASTDNSGITFTLKANTLTNDTEVVIGYTNT